MVKHIFTILFMLTEFTIAQYTLDHVIFTTPDLSQTKQTLDSLGFTTKPGRLHANGINNIFVKFQTGPYLEFIEVKYAKDRLAEFYKQHTDSASINPIFLSFRIDDNTLDSLKKFYSENNIDHNITDLKYAKLLGLPLVRDYKPYFFINYTHLPDDTAYINHNNGALYIEDIKVGKSMASILKNVVNINYFESSSGNLIDQISIKIKHIDKLFNQTKNVTVRQHHGTTGVSCSIDDKLEIIFIE
ncbi:MAG: hypothetical protein SCALA702_37870 [Melioribacteraceae bacterium]|nr:MAG: hypothetical protein SCALA702_37870 [Melioribacteraceae bacterium]